MDKRKELLNLLTKPELKRFIRVYIKNISIYVKEKTKDQLINEIINHIDKKSDYTLKTQYDKLDFNKIKDDRQERKELGKIQEVETKRRKREKLKKDKEVKKEEKKKEEKKEETKEEKEEKKKDELRKKVKNYKIRLLEINEELKKLYAEYNPKLKKRMEEVIEEKRNKGQKITQAKANTIREKLIKDEFKSSLYDGVSNLFNEGEGLKAKFEDDIDKPEISLEFENELKNIFRKDYELEPKKETKKEAPNMSFNIVRLPKEEKKEPKKEEASGFNDFNELGSVINKFIINNKDNQLLIKVLKNIGINPKGLLTNKISQGLTILNTLKTVKERQEFVMALHKLIS
jgi:hypothetical protein